MNKHLMIGVDGGGTKSIIRIEDDSGNLLGETTSGPANVSISVEQAWQSIMDGLLGLAKEISLPLEDYHLHAGMGLAGTELIANYGQFLNAPHIFNTLVVKSDAHVACLAAHSGEDGAIIIVGTGVVGYQIVNREITRVSGWGFPHDDVGGGAWLGLQAIKVALYAVDKRLPQSGLSEAILAHFDRDPDRIVHWSRYATPTTYATLAPLVIEQSECGDAIALDLVRQAAQSVDHLGLTLIACANLESEAEREQLPLTFVGSIAPFLQSYLSDELRSHVRPLQHPLARGAIILIRDSLTRMVTIAEA